MIHMVHIHDTRALVVAGAFCLAYGGYLMYRAARSNSLVEVEARALEEGQPLDADYLRVRGVPRWELGVRGEGDDSHRLIVPFVSTEWTTTRPAAVFLEILDKDEALDRERLQGSVTGFRVPGRGIGRRFRERFEDERVRETSDPILLSPNYSPASIVREAWVFTGLGMAMLLIYLVIPKRFKKSFKEL